MSDLNALSLEALYARLAETGLIRRLIALARDEDLGGEPPAAGQPAPLIPQPVGDITSLVAVPESAQGQAVIVARQAAVLAGARTIPAILQALAPDVAFQGRAADGHPVEAGQPVGIVGGPVRQILAAERTLLNMLGRLSGVATLARRYVEAVKGTNARIFDTRKTTPGLRLLEKYAARCGGAHCHRIGLYDAVLIKDNHLAAVAPGDLAAWLTDAVARARALAAEAKRPLAFIEVEVDTADQLDRVFAANAAYSSGGGGGGAPLVDVILLDNFTPARLRDAVALRDGWGAGAIELEASGGVTLETVRAIAETGVERISVGAITHQATGIDFGLDMQ